MQRLQGSPMPTPRLPIEGPRGVSYSHPRTLASPEVFLPTWLGVVVVLSRGRIDAMGSASGGGLPHHPLLGDAL